MTQTYEEIQEENTKIRRVLHQIIGLLERMGEGWKPGSPKRKCEHCPHDVCSCECRMCHARAELIIDEVGPMCAECYNKWKKEKRSEAHPE